MKDFILEEQIGDVKNLNTKEYLNEVISSYNSGNYRAAVTVLYTVVIYDLLKKLEVLRDIYKDTNAEQILTNVKDNLSANPKNPDWELKLINDICKLTNIITIVEKEQLINLKNERNYAAHPIVNIENEGFVLNIITKETAKDLIRKAFEIVFLKDAILARNISMEIIGDLNDFYNRVNNNGLESFLKTKYFNRMNQERKDYLFRVLWKYVFLLDNEGTINNRECNWWGVYYLYQENTYHYNILIKKDEDYYLNAINLNDIDHKDDSNKNFIWIYKIKNSRIMKLIKFIEYNNGLFTIMNDYIKNLLISFINNIYMSEDIIDHKLYEYSYDDLFRAKLILRAEAVFLSTSLEEHFNLVYKMINNYQYSRKNWTEISNYSVLSYEELNIIYLQAEFRGCQKEFITFLMKYCFDAQSFDQAVSLFQIVKAYNKILNKDDYYKILIYMNNNSQFYSNKSKFEMIDWLETEYMKKYSCGLLGCEEEKIMYPKLFDINKIDIDNGKLEEVINILNDKADFHSVWSLWHNVLYPMTVSLKEITLNCKFNYDNILRVLSNRDDMNYNPYYVEMFKKKFDLL